MADLLALRQTRAVTPLPPMTYMPTGHSKNVQAEVEVRPGSLADNQRIVNLHLPPEALVVLIHRADEDLFPRAATRLMAGDSVQVLAQAEELREVQRRLGLED